MDECALYSEPELYDLLFPGGGSATFSDEGRRQRLLASEQFYLEEARKAGGQVLELACGTGRLTIPLAQAGIDIAGADLSNAMLEAARAKARAAGVDVRFIQTDIRAIGVPGEFSTILIPGSSLLHLHTFEDLKRCLISVREHLAPGGRLVFDVSKWDVRVLARDAGERSPVLRVHDPVRGEVAIEEICGYDAAKQVRRIVWYFSAPGAPDFRVIEYHLRVIFPQELLLLLDATGFELRARYGEFPRQPFDSSSPRQICVCSPYT